MIALVVLILLLILIVESNDISSTKKAVHKALAILNTNENLKKVEISLEENTDINVTTCKVIDYASNEESYTSDTTTLFLSLKLSLGLSLELSLSPSSVLLLASLSFLSLE